MSNAIVRSVLVAAVLSVGGLVVAGQAAGPRTSPALAETFTALQSAVNAKRYAEATAKAREVLASPRKTPDDVYAANYFLVQIAGAQGNPAGQIAGMEGMLESGFSPGVATQNQFRKALASAYFRQKNYAQALKYGTALIQSGSGDPDVYTVVGQSYYQQRNYGEAVKLFGGLVSNAEKAGRRPDRNDLTFLYSSYSKAGNQDAAQTTLETLVRHYPDPNTWLQLLYEVKKERLDPRQKLHLYRLMESTGNLKRGPDFMDYSNAATALGLASESYHVLEAALKAKAFEAQIELDRADRYIRSAKVRADEARAALPKLETAARAAPTGNEFVSLGMAHFSFGQYRQAIEALKAGIARGGLKNVADAQLTLGTAQLKAGQKAEAAQTFKAIKTDDEVTQRIAKLWALHAS
ncbi:MAG TPA: tetratricopeptide repeat protein [Steroidobacteraceae bacterium]|nr:tetratricopeptide repeat protein [Steroidobacteraceae bacterium]